MSGRDLDIDPEEAAELLRENPDARLLDVREPAEWNTARIEGGVLATPEVSRAIMEDWPRSTPIVVYCHHGIRSRFFAMRLAQAGFTEVHNLRGGIEAWSTRVDSSVPRYEIRYGGGIVVVPRRCNPTRFDGPGSG